MTAASSAQARMAGALADELVTASRILNELAYDLGSDAATLRRHLASLQKIDEVTQIQLAVAGLLREPHVDAVTLSEVGLQDMADRLRASAVDL